MGTDTPESSPSNDPSSSPGLSACLVAPTCPLFFSVQRPLATSLSLLPCSPQQVEELSPPRMTSAAPAKKPYRKAPPEHRELRLEVPGSQLEQEVSKSGAPALAGRCRPLRRGSGCPEGISGPTSWGEGVAFLVHTWALSCSSAGGSHVDS